MQELLNFLKFTMIKNIYFTQSGMKKFDEYFDKYAKEGLDKNDIMDNLLDNLKFALYVYGSKNIQLKNEHQKTGNAAKLELDREKDLVITYY